ncbi:DUF6115 domain-containing protein [Amphibacillus sp. Q70]|uniref:DUF6115 domain-containing protein n=1 Tax=Amphibacillus sp. Q70 TaxID=3453416 RepID=UPI003F827AD0
MYYILLLISFLIHILTFVMIRQLKVKLDQPNENKKVLAQQQKQIEELLAVYLLEIREENEKLLDLINKGQQSASQKDSKSEAPLTQNESELNATTEKYQDYQPIVPDEEDIVEQSFAAQVLSLAEQGYTAETIAKKLNCGKTEVELLLKFQQKQKK